MNKAKLKKSIVAGLAVESLFLLPLAFSGFGPCGPNNPIGLLAILLQLPFLALAVLIGKAIGASDQAFMVLTFLSGWAAWAALSYLLLSLKERKAGNVNAESGNPKQNNVRAAGYSASHRVRSQCTALRCSASAPHRGE